MQIVTLDENTSEFSAKATFDHPYPTTKIMWIPDHDGNKSDLLATSGDYLRIWRVGDSDVHMESLLNNVSDVCNTLMEPNLSQLFLLIE